MADIGLIGLGTMGSALALNMAEKGNDVAVWNRTRARTDEFLAEAGDLASKLSAPEGLDDFVNSIRSPRAIVVMVKAGAPAQAVMDSLKPYLDAGDILIDAGNADFNDTRSTEAALKAEGFDFMGIGVSGGEEGARHGPSIMAGGSVAAWERLAPILKSIAAKFEDQPCAAHIGSDGAGHFVKTVHNGIEYADMQMIAEVYGLMRHMNGMSPAGIGAQFEAWNSGALASYLVEITGQVLQADDPETGKPMVDVILDSAGQKGTGRWTVIEALKLGQSANVIEAAVGARGWSAARDLRALGAEMLGSDVAVAPVDLEDLAAALLSARILAYAQGFTLIGAASDEFNWSVDRAEVAEIWRAGCIIRSALLDTIAGATRAGLPGDALYLADGLREPLLAGLPALRRIVGAAVAAGFPVPALSGAVAYLDTMRQPRGTADLIQAQRDFFGAHGFGRVDAEGQHHGPWGS